MTLFSEDVRPITDLKTGAARIVDQVVRSGRPVLLTRRGRGAVVLDLERYEALVRRADFVDAVEAGAGAAREGRLHSDAEAQAILDSFGEPRER